MRYGICTRAISYNAWYINLPERTVKVELLLKTELDNVRTMHCTVVPLFTDVAGTVRLDCTVPEDELTTVVIPRLIMSELEDDNPSTLHAIITPVPAQ